MSKPNMRALGVFCVGLVGCASAAPPTAPIVNLDPAAVPAEEPTESPSPRAVARPPADDGEEVCFAPVVVDAEDSGTLLGDPRCFDAQLVPVEVCEFNVVERYFREGRLGIAGPLFRELALRAPATESGADAADRLVETASRVVAARPERREVCARELTVILEEVRPIVCASPMARAKEHCARYDAALSDFGRAR